jgi:hypothetical protein
LFIGGLPMIRNTPDLSNVAEEGAARAPRGRVVVTAAAATATGAFACAVGCVLPFALPAVALASAGGIIAWLVRAQGWMMYLALIAVGWGWLWVAWQSFGAKARPARSTLCAMGGATLLVAFAVAWPMLEPSVIRLLIS